MVSLDIGGIVRDSVGNPKVDQLELTTDQHEIGRLQIRVYDLLLMDNMYCLQHLQIDKSISIVPSITKKKDDAPAANNTPPKPYS